MNGKFKVVRGSVSRKTNELANKKDVMRRLHIQSSQEVRARLELFKPKKRKKKSVDLTDDDKMVLEMFKKDIPDAENHQIIVENAIIENTENASDFEDSFEENNEMETEP